MAIATNHLTMSIDELRVFIPAVAEELTVIVQSEPGCGKTSLLSMMAADNGDQWRKVGDDFPTDKYDYIYVDCPCKDMQDVGMTIPNHSIKELEYYVASLFKLRNGKPKAILLDEFMKSPKLLQIVFTRLMLERCAGDVPVPDGSVIFGTSNNASDGVGDTMLAHAGNRVCLVEMKKPNASSWLRWASDAGISRIIRAWVAMYPRALASYRDGGQEDNPYIFNPAKPQLSFCSPRSLAKADVIIRKSAIIGENATHAGIAGTIGRSAADDMMTFIAIEKSVTSLESVLKNPKTVPVPNQIAAQMILMFNAIDGIETQDELSSFMEFLERIESSEVQTIFFTMCCTYPRMLRIAKNNEKVKNWAKDNYFLL